MDLRTGRPLATHEIAELLAEARARTLLLVAPLSEEELRTQHSSLMSPIVWDLGHIAHFEEVWLLKNLDAPKGTGEALEDIYNPFEHPRSTRDELALPSEAEARSYMARVRRRVLDRLDGLDPGASTPLLEDDFVFRMVLQHEYQHNETILQTLGLKEGRPHPAPRPRSLPEPSDGAWVPEDEMVRFPGGEVLLGTDDRSGACDNERPRHERTLEPFWIDTVPVTKGRYREFVEDGGYRRPDLWSPEGRAWLSDEGARASRFWEREDGEWTASPFRGYPCFKASPYAEYSEVFFGDDYRVLRGGSWATRPGAIRNTFRNWDFPIRRQIFSGFRCARDE